LRNFNHKVKLTEYSHGGGCGCKIAPAVLEEILKATIPSAPYANLLVGNDTKDDAAVYDQGNGTGLISTTDFFTPIVNDPFDFGRIAAANAISDIYAMGGKPVLAVAILGWPVNKIPVEHAARVIDGAKTICEEAGIPLAGGHSIDSPEPFFGLAVNGFVELKNLKKNSTAKKGDLLFLSKKIGTGILSTAEKRNILLPEHEKTAVQQMAELNKIGERTGKLDYVHAMTDVTGFGLLGHLTEMSDGSNLTAELRYDSVPLLDGVKHYASQFIYPDNTMRNFNAYKDKTEGIAGESLLTLCDPQTNGGLLVAVDAAHENDFIKEFGTEVFTKIGVMHAFDGKSVRIV
jgi:selenide, water dikinase